MGADVEIPKEHLVNASEFDKMLGFERIEGLHGSTYKDNSTVIIIPTRGTGIHYKFMQAFQSLVSPMNGKRTIIYAEGFEVGDAFNTMIQNVLNHPELSKWKYILSVEDDNLPMPDGHIRLLESIEQGYDAVGGLYHTKGDVNYPLALGDPDIYRMTGELEMRPRNILEWQARGKGHLMETNCLPCGFTLYKMDLFRQTEGPWFTTLSDWDPIKGGAQATQDCAYWMKARRAGKRCAVDLRVRVGHIDPATGTVY